MLSAMAAPGGKHGSVLAVAGTFAAALVPRISPSIWGGNWFSFPNRIAGPSAFWISISSPGRWRPIWIWHARKKVYELLSQTASMDADAFFAALQVFQDKLHVLTAPSDIVCRSTCSAQRKLIALSPWPCAHFDLCDRGSAARDHALDGNGAEHVRHVLRP